jgi:hypothetical protein
MEPLLKRAKEICGLFAGASAVLYIFGYLVVRSRSHALGTDPDLALIEETYVFAGARFAIITTVALLLTAPFMAGLYYAARRIIPALPAAAQWTVQFLAALALGLLVLRQLFFVLRPDGILACGDPTALQNRYLRAVLLENSFRGFGLVLLGTGAAALSAAWLWQNRRAARRPGLPLLIMAVVLVLQVLLLPLQVGAYYPDLKTQELAQAPASLTGVSPPLWIIDRGSDRVVLLIRNRDNRFALVKVKSEAVDGIATISKQLDEILQHGEPACSVASSSRSD